MTKPEEKFYKKLLVEGNDDLHVVLTLCERYQILKNFDIIDCKGIDKLIGSISTRLKESEINTIGMQEDPGTPIGLSITKQYLTTKSPICESCITWLKTLFS